MKEEVKCAYCTAEFCEDELSKTPGFCPRRTLPDELEHAKKVYSTDPMVKRVSEVAGSVETEGYRVWPRVQELIEFSKRMGFSKLGVAFCVGLREETLTLCKILESHGFNLSSVCCAIDGGCNPVGQAMVLNRAATEMNIIMGLCIGHDLLFTRFSNAPVTTLVVKDRVTCHNSVGPLVNRYWRDSLFKKD